MAYLKRKRTKGGKTRRTKTLKKKRTNKKKNLVDIGVTRPRITGEPGMNQNLSVTNTLAKSMSQNRNMAQGLAASQSLGMGQSLA
jgi:hypothetical protein